MDVWFELRGFVGRKEGRREMGSYLRKGRSDLVCFCCCRFERKRTADEAVEVLVGRVHEGVDHHLQSHACSCWCLYLC